MASSEQRPKTLTVRLDDRSHEILSTLAEVRGQNKTQVLKRMLREEMAREDLLRTLAQVQPPNFKEWKE